MKKSVEKGVAVIPDEFKKVIFDFVGDISNTFPEYRETLGSFLEGSTNDSANVVSILYKYCSNVYPERFFDILYKNDKIFNKEDAANVNVNTHFLPNIDFCSLWNTEGISDATRETIWKYLQLILMTIITNIEDKKSFGDAANLFEAINENELRGKLEETIQQMYNMFEPNNASSTDAGADNATNDESNNGKKPSFNFFDWAKDIGGDDDEGDEGEKGSSSSFSSANAESIHEHISNILNGKIGKLAKEIAEETAKDVDFDMDFDESKGDGVNFQNVFQKMFKNPGKLMGLVKSVGSKLDQKFKSGEIKESELMQEASDLLSKMKNMPGMNNLTDMLNKMGMGNMGGNMKGNAGGKMNFGAMQSQLQKNMKMSKMKERMQEKLAQQQQQKQQQEAQQLQQLHQQKTHPAPAVFSTGETVERTPVDASIPSLAQNQNKKKHKKNKSKK
uniref:Uncharacterized protein n=1 Tax=viral metagenome TaxID=1070528 RepID=A0A6C0EZN3_9ZZZZ